MPSSDGVPFRYAGLRRLFVTGGVLAAGGLGMTVARVELLGVSTPRSVAVITGMAGVVLGAWFLVAAIRRWGAEDPAIEMRPGQLWLHANPGRRITLESTEVRGVDAPVPCRGMQRFMLGDSSIRVKTTRPEGLFASDVLIGQAFVAEPLDEVAQRLQDWLRSSGSGQDPKGREAFAYPSDGHRRQLWFGVTMLVLSPLLLLPGAALLGVELPPLVQWVGAVGGVGLGIRMITWALQRARSDEPAVAVRGGELHLHVHPGRRIVLGPSDIVEVQPVSDLQGFGRRLAHGSRGFRVVTTATGARSMTLDIGNRMVEGSLEDVRATVSRFSDRAP